MSTLPLVGRYLRLALAGPVRATSRRPPAGASDDAARHEPRNLGRAGAGQSPSVEAAMVKDLGTNFERDTIEIVREALFRDLARAGDEALERGWPARCRWRPPTHCAGAPTKYCATSLRRAFTAHERSRTPTGRRGGAPVRTALRHRGGRRARTATGRRPCGRRSRGLPRICWYRGAGGAGGDWHDAARCSKGRRTQRAGAGGRDPARRLAARPRRSAPRRATDHCAGCRSSWSQRTGGRLAGVARRVPWGGAAAHLVVMGGAGNKDCIALVESCRGASGLARPRTGRRAA